MEDESKVINDIDEDQREENESVEDLKDQGDDKIADDIAEDEREEGESVEDLKRLLSDALIKNAKLEDENKRLQNDLNEAHRVFMQTPRESEEEKNKTYDSMRNDIR